MKSLSTIKPLKRDALVEIIYRPCNLPKKTIENLQKRFTEFTDLKFKKHFEQSTKLSLKLFAPGMFYIDYCSN